MKGKERIIIISVVFLIVLVTGVLAVGFSPSSLTFDLEANEEECQTIILSSDSETIKVSDKWAENKDIEWKVSLFDREASYHGISISYDSELLIDEREVEVCLSGNKAGEYHGVLLLTEEQKGSSVIQMGVWLKVIISELAQTTTTSSGESSGEGSGSSDGGGGGGGELIQQTTTSSQQTTQTQEEEQTSEEEENNAGITGAVVGGGKKNWRIIIIILAVLLILGLIVYYKNYKRRKL